jgi:hypothetical protein
VLPRHTFRHRAVSAHRAMTMAWRFSFFPAQEYELAAVAIPGA